MRIHPLAGAVFLACVCAPAAAAQEVLRPGSAAVSTQTIGDRVEEFDVYAGDAGERGPIGRMTLRTRVVTVGGEAAVVRTETLWIDDELVQVDSFTLHRLTLAPLEMRSSFTDTGVSLAFAPGTVRQVDDGGWGADTVDVPLPEPVFLGGTTDLLLASLPLAPGYRADLAVYDADEGIGTLGIDVERIEEVALPDGGRVSAWRVAVEENGWTSTYWMDRESRTLVQFESAGGAFRIIRSRGSRSRARPTR
jgi:hypothetical protein